MPQLQRLSAEHSASILAFERENRAYFAASISDRGGAFFDEFDERFTALLEEQEAGVCAFHVLVDEDGTLLGRFNLFDIADGTADLGYRVARDASGRGTATTGVRALCRLAVTGYGLRTLRAATSDENLASQRVLQKAGFVAVGRADPAEIGGKSGIRYELELGPPSASESSEVGGAGVVDEGVVAGG